MRLYSTLIPSILLASLVPAQLGVDTAGILIRSPKNQTFFNISTTITIPSVDKETAEVGSGFFAYIGADTTDTSECDTFIKAGIHLVVEQHKSFRWQFVYEQESSPPSYIDLDVSGGDNVTIAWSQLSDSLSPSVSIESAKLSCTASVNRTCGSSVVWALEPLLGANRQIVNFNAMTFNNATAYALDYSKEPKEYTPKSNDTEVDLYTIQIGETVVYLNVPGNGILFNWLNLDG